MLEDHDTTDPFTDLEPLSASSDGEAGVFADAGRAIQALRQRALDQAEALAAEFLEKREELRLSVGDGFIAIYLDVGARGEGRYVHVNWRLGHFRNGVRTGSTRISKRRGSTDYDLATLRAKTPEWARPLIDETEMRARPIREALARLTEMDAALGVVMRRLSDPTPTPAANPPSTLDLADDDA